MDPITERVYEDPRAWTVPAEASEASLAMATLKDRQELYRMRSFHGSFYLRPSGLLAGFSIHLALPPESRQAGRRNQPAPSLYWESIDLSHEGAQEFHGRCRIRLGAREAWAPVTGSVLEIPWHRADRPYLKIMLDTRFHASTLRWPAEARWRPRQVSLRFFSEIRPPETASSGSGVPRPRG